MKNSKTVPVAIALLILIAVIDNVFIIELQPGFEDMALVKGADEGISPPAISEAGSEANLSTEQFWIDKEHVNMQDFAQFLAMTDYAATSHGVETEDSVSAAAQIQSVELKASVQDAMAYCEWLGKELPTEKQFALAAHSASLGLDESASENRRQLLTRDMTATAVSNFRCVKNLTASMN